MNNVEQYLAVCTVYLLHTSVKVKVKRYYECYSANYKLKYVTPRNHVTCLDNGYTVSVANDLNRFHVVTRRLRLSM